MTAHSKMFAIIWILSVSVMDWHIGTFLGLRLADPVSIIAILEISLVERKICYVACRVCALSFLIFSLGISRSVMRCVRLSRSTMCFLQMT